MKLSEATVSDASVTILFNVGVRRPLSDHVRFSKTIVFPRNPSKDEIVQAAYQIVRNEKAFKESVKDSESHVKEHYGPMDLTSLHNDMKKKKVPMPRADVRRMAELRVMTQYMTIQISYLDKQLEVFNPATVPEYVKYHTEDHQGSDAFIHFRVIGKNQ